MNKANVFLLVVVSSLLTYISTATQPSATAGVAQEKWEYGEIRLTRCNLGTGMESGLGRVIITGPRGEQALRFEARFRSDSDPNTFNCTSSSLQIFDESVIEWTNEEFGMGTYANGARAFFDKKQTVLDLIGADGWEVFQVEKSVADHEIWTDVESTSFHVRRRVQ